MQDLIKQGGKSELAELKVNSNAEELSAKEYAAAVEKLQVALKREHQITIMKALNEKQKSAGVSGLSKVFEQDL